MCLSTGMLFIYKNDMKRFCSFIIALICLLLTGTSHEEANRESIDLSEQIHCSPNTIVTSPAEYNGYDVLLQALYIPVQPLLISTPFRNTASSVKRLRYSKSGGFQFTEYELPLAERTLLPANNERLITLYFKPVDYYVYALRKIII